MKMKPAICCRCHKPLRGMVPDDAENVTCYKCAEAEYRKQRREQKQQKRIRDESLM